jgi:hypothetical protein
LIFCCCSFLISLRPPPTAHPDANPGSYT